MPYVKGQSGNLAGKPKGIKNRETLLKEERRAMFEARISQKWEDTIDKLRPEYVADQFMGVATQKIEHSGELKVTSLSAEAIAEAEKIVRERMLNG